MVVTNTLTLETQIFLGPHPNPELCYLGKFYVNLMCFFSFKIGSVINLPHKILVLLKWEDLEALSIVPGNSKSSITFGYFYLISKTPSKSPCQVGHPTQKRSRIFIMLLKRRIRVLMEGMNLYLEIYLHKQHFIMTSREPDVKLL